MNEGGTNGGEQAQKPEGLLGALFVIVALALVLATGIAVLGLRIQSADAMALYTESFPGDEPLPLGLELVDGMAMAGEARHVVLRRSSAQDEPDAEVELPERVLLQRFGSALPATRQFAPNRENLPRDLTDDLEKWEEKPYRFEAVTRRGTVQFAGVETDYIAERTFEADGTFFDSIRVNLTVGQKGSVLDAAWPSEFDGADVATLVPLLERIQLPEPDPDEPPTFDEVRGE